MHNIRIEILNSLKQLKNNKSPGYDGLTAEFYKFFWNNFKEMLIDSITLSLRNGELPNSQKNGVITLIPKKRQKSNFAQKLTSIKPSESRL